MARRRKKQSGFDQLVSAPWPFGLVAGVVGFLAIRYGIGWTFAVFDSPYFAELTGSSSTGLFAPLAWAWLGMCWLGASLSYLKTRGKSGRSRKPAAAGVERSRPEWATTGTSSSHVSGTMPETPGAQGKIDATSPAPVTYQNIDNLSWLQFEHLVAASFRKKGFSAELTADGADEGVDIVLRERDNVLLVQCKHWGSYSVGVKIVRELFGVMHAKDARKAILATSGVLTRDARRFCDDNAVHCIDRSGLLDFVDPAAMPAQHEISENRSSLCPLCGDAMKLRTARKSGNRFYGCRRYPRCRGTRAA